MDNKTIKRSVRASDVDLRSGDTVCHIPTGEEWIVAGVYPEKDRLSWGGWPGGYVSISDCVIIEQCDDDEHFYFLNKMAAIPSSKDPRRIYAEKVLNLIQKEQGSDE